MIEEMDFGFAKGGRIKASNGLGVLMDIFNAGNQRIETGDIDARFRPLPEIDEDTVSEDEKRIALLEDEIRYLMEGGTLEANRDLIEKYAAELKMLKEKQDPSLRTRRSEGGKVQVYQQENRLTPEKECLYLWEGLREPTMCQQCYRSMNLY